MNYYKRNILIKTNSQEQREQIFDFLNNKQFKDDDLNYGCAYREGEDIGYFIRMRGGIGDAVNDIFDLPKKYPDITEDVWFYEESWAYNHKKYHNGYWEESWTINDAIESYNAVDGSFNPYYLEFYTYRTVSDIDGNVISDVEEMVPYPIELMDDGFRKEYEMWKENPQKWEEYVEKRRHVEPIKFTGGPDDLPF